MNHNQYDDDKIIMKLNKEKPASSIQPAINASSKRNASIKKNGFDDFYESNSEDNKKKRKTGIEKRK